MRTKTQRFVDFALGLVGSTYILGGFGAHCWKPERGMFRHPWRELVFGPVGLVTFAAVNAGLLSRPSLITCEDFRQNLQSGSPRFGDVIVYGAGKEACHVAIWIAEAIIIEAHDGNAKMPLDSLHAAALHGAQVRVGFNPRSDVLGYFRFPEAT